MILIAIIPLQNILGLHRLHVRLHKKLLPNFIVNFAISFLSIDSLFIGIKKSVKTPQSVIQKLSKVIQKLSIQNFIVNAENLINTHLDFQNTKKKCNYLHCLEDEEDSIDTIIPSNNVETLLKNILEENKELRTEIKNLKMGNTYNNTQNNQFNINMFLNEKCKNAMNLEDFVEKIKLSLEDLKYTSENGYVKGISNIFIKNLNDMDVTERPIHCSDQKRLQFYVKNDDAWSKDDNNVKLDNSIEKISKKQLQTIKDWIKENPNYLDSEVKTDEYFTLVKNITQPNNEKNLKTIKKKVGENVKIDK